MSFDHDRPEGLLGAILAMEGVRDSLTIVNGPTGCKYYPSSASESAYASRGGEAQTYNPFKYYREFFFSQPRVPCTYLDGNDYIMGSSGKLDRLVENVKDLDPKIIGIINSPGASLIGEDLNIKTTVDVPLVKIESPEPSVSMGEGFQKAAIGILEAVRPKKVKKRDGVNLIGISIWHLGWEDSIRELKRLLRMCDIKVNIVVGAGWSAADIFNSGKAELNVVMHNDFGSDVAEWYLENTGIPFVEFERGAPIGFDALESWISAICKALDKDDAAVMQEIREKRQRTARILSTLSSERRPPRGRTFSVVAPGSIAYPVTEFLYSYLGMVPVAIDTGMDHTMDTVISAFAEDNRLSISNDAFDTPADVMIGDGNNISSAVQRNMISGGFDIIRPGLTNMNVMERPVLGLNGTLRLLDSVLNILERSN